MCYRSWWAYIFQEGRGVVPRGRRMRSLARKPARWNWIWLGGALCAVAVLAGVAVSTAIGGPAGPAARGRAAGTAPGTAPGAPGAGAGAGGRARPPPAARPG